MPIFLCCRPSTSASSQASLLRPATTSSQQQDGFQERLAAIAKSHSHNDYNLGVNIVGITGEPGEGQQASAMVYNFANPIESTQDALMRELPRMNASERKRLSKGIDEAKAQSQASASS